MGGNFEGLNIHSKNKPVGETPKRNGADNFDTIQYTSKKDGKTYIAKKYNITDGNKSVTGVFVAEKGAKPDKNGKINGQFMSYESFMKKLSDELPSVNSNLISSYYSNIHRAEVDESFPLECDESAPLENDILTPEEVDNKLKSLLDSGVHLRDGSVLLKELREGGSAHKISSNEDGTYTVTSIPIRYGAKAITQNMSEIELITNRSIFGGAIKQLDNGNYRVTFRDGKGMLQKKEMQPFEVLDFLEDSRLTSVYKEEKQ